MNDIKQKIETFISDTNSESAIVINSGGEVIFSIHTEHKESVGAMGDAILSMCNMFLTDLGKGQLKQAFLKTTTNIVVFNTINESSALIVFTGTGANLGLFLHKVEELAYSL